ncbi:hypothetical protein B0H14DRAFT_2402385 [Mycena olivaceomarginata]|nr:hypothetical protein B0H14DRAFT_2402385 [Mycena olivaceomarginata]
MGARHVPADLVAFYEHDLAGQSPRLKFDDFISAPYIITNGVGPGAPSSGGLYQSYNAPLLEVVTSPKESAAGAYYDDAFLAAAPTFSGCDDILSQWLDHRAHDQVPSHSPPSLPSTTSSAYS